MDRREDATEPFASQGNRSGIGDIADRFVASWRAALESESRINPPHVEAYLDESSDLDRSDLLSALLVADLDFRRRRGERPLAEEYTSRFPDFANVVHQVFHSDL